MKRFAFLAAACLALCSCQGTTAQPQQGLEVSTACYPLQYLVEEIAGKEAHITSLTPAGTEPHDLELATKDLVQLHKADLVLYQKGFQPAVDEAIRQAEPKTALDISTAVALVPTTAHEGEHALVGISKAHEHAELDPHFWLDPLRMEAAIAPINRALTQADPEHKEQFAANAAALKKRLDDLDSSYRQRLRNCGLSQIIVSHEAYGYLADRYGFLQVGLSGFDPEQEASPTQLAKIGKIAADAGVEVIFSENLLNQKSAKTLAADLGIKSEVLDPIETKVGKADYLDTMKLNLDKIANALQCKTK